MKLALTGATGFVGSHLLDLLLARGDDVACLARSSAAVEALRARGCRVVAGDLADIPALASLVGGADVVCHLAGLVAARSAREFQQVNAGGTARIAEASRAARVSRLVYVSSLAVTGPAERGRPLDESAGPRPVSPYGRSKLEGEQAVRASGVTFTIVRPPAVYGPRDRELLRVFRLARFGFAPLLGDGRQELSLVHAADLAAAIAAAAGSSRTAGGVYHAAHPEVVSQRRLVDMVGRAMDRRVRSVALPAALVRAALALTGTAARLAGRATLLASWKAPELLAPAWTCTSRALERDAGWRAAIPLERGLAETAAWYRQAGWL